MIYLINYDKIFEKYRGNKWLKEFMSSIRQIMKNPRYSIKIEKEKRIITLNNIERFKIKFIEIFGNKIDRIFTEDGYLSVSLKIKNTNNISIIFSIKELEDEYFYLGISLYNGHLYFWDEKIICDQEIGLFLTIKEIKKLIE